MDTYLRKINPPSCFVRAWPTGLQLAGLAFENIPVRARMAQIAVPEYQSGVRLDHLEGMVASSWYSHCANSFDEPALSKQSREFYNCVMVSTGTFSTTCLK
jgi:hypothetical protein